MILTGTCKTDLEKWFNENYNDYWNYYQTKPTLINALIIDFFDSKGIFIEIIRDWEFKHWIFLLDTHESILYDSRQKATEEAIKFTNEYYNKQYGNRTH